MNHKEKSYNFLMDKKRSIAVIDLKAFYAFVECVDRNLNPMTTPLVVTDIERGEGTIVLSVSPFLKALGIPSRLRKRDLPDIPGMIYAKPRMSRYIEKSCEVISIILNYVGEDDIHVYSIDEVFINLGPYLDLYNLTPYALIKKIQKNILQKTKLITTAGISYNMFLAKAALDLDAKNKPPYISEWNKKDIETKLWPIKPLSKVWGISRGYETKLNKIGIETVEQLAKTPRELLVQKFGIIGGQLHDLANGIDDSDIRNKYTSKDTSFTVGQVLPRNYSKEETKLIIKEMADDLCYRLREQHLLAKTFSLSVSYANNEGGFHRRLSVDIPTNDSQEILNELIKLYDRYVTNKDIRSVHLGAATIKSDEIKQMSIFDDLTKKKDREQLIKTIDLLKQKYGKNIILRGSSLLKESTAKERHEQIGGHHK